MKRISRRKSSETRRAEPVTEMGGAPSDRWTPYALGAFLFVVVLAIFPFTNDVSAPKFLALRAIPPVLACWMAMWVHRRNPAPLRPPLFLGILTATLAVGLVCALFAVNKGYALSCLALPLCLFTLYLASAWTLTSPSRLWTITLALCSAMALAAFYGVVQYTGHDPFPWQDATGMLRHAPATFGNPNYASHALLLAGVLSVGLACARRNAWPLLFVVVFLGHLGLTRTRGTLLAIAVAVLLVVVALWLRRKIQSPVRAVMVTFAVMAISGIVAVALGMTVLYVRTGKPFPLDASILLRAHSFHGATQMILDKPFVGRGPGGYYIENPLYWSPFEQERFDSVRAMNDHVHNETLEAAVENGIAGAALYLGFLICGVGYGLYLAFSSQDRQRRVVGYTAAALFTAAFVDGQFGFNLHLPVSASIVYVTAGALAGMWPRTNNAVATARVVPFASTALRWGVVVLAIALPVFGTLDFAHQLYLRNGLAALYFNAPKPAYTSLTQATQLMPQYWDAWYHLGRASLLVGKPDEAMACFERTLKLNPTYIDAHIRIAQQLVNQSAAAQGPDVERIENAALDHARKAAAIAPSYPGAEDVLARVLMLRATRLTKNAALSPDAVRRLWQDAEDHLRKALVGAINREELLRFLAQACIAQQDLDGAAQAFAQAVEAAPDDTATWAIFFAFAKQFNRYSDLLHAVNASIDTESIAPAPNTARLARLYIARARAVAEGTQQNDEAVAYALRAIQADPSSSDAWAALHTYTQALGQRALFAETLHDTNARLAKDGRAVPGSDLVTKVFAQGPVAAPEAARALLQRLDDIMTKKTSGDPAALAWTIDVLAVEGEKDAPSAAAIGQLAMDLGTAAAVVQDYGKAERLLRVALPYLAPTDYTVCVERLGNVLVLAQRPLDAIALLKDAVTRMPNATQIRWLLARTYASTGQPAQAHAEYQALLLQPTLPPSARQAIQQEIAALTAPRK